MRSSRAVVVANRGPYASLVRKTVVASLVFPLLLVACSRSVDRSVRAGGASPTFAPATSSSPQQDSAGATKAEPRCQDRLGDSRGPLDLTSVGITSAFGKVTFTYEYQGTIPQKGSLLFMSSDGQKQYGYKLVDGQEASQFVFEFFSKQQKKVTQEAAVGRNKAVISFAASDVIFPRVATVAVDGVEVDHCFLGLE
jgi:hypothetical protein